MPAEADWFLQSLCSAHLEEHHQFGEGIGVEDDLFITNEEWINYAPNKPYVGISVSPVGDVWDSIGILNMILTNFSVITLC
jgi:hypothetical protein